MRPSRPWFSGNAEEETGNEEKDPVGGFGSRSRYARHDRHRSCPDDLAHLHGRPAAAGRHAPDRRRIREAQPEREGRGRSGRRHVRAAAAIPQHGARLAGLVPRRGAHRRDPPGAMGGRAVGRAPRQLSRRRQGQGDGAIPARLPRGQHGRRQGHLAALFRGCAIPLLPQGPAREARRAAAEDVGRGQGRSAEDHAGREATRTCAVSRRRERRSKGRSAPSRCRSGAPGVP